MTGKDLLSIADLTKHDIENLISDAIRMKAQGWNTALKGKTLALLFEKPSLRTRVSFELAMRQLGGEVIYLSPQEVGMGRRESTPDVAQVLGRYVDAIAARTFHHHTLETLAVHAGIPIINALSDEEHPCQALADLITIYEKKGILKGLKLTYIGDGNNVAASLVMASVMLGIDVTISTPKGYNLTQRVQDLVDEFAEESGASIKHVEDPEEAIASADVIYTDVWVSMGQEDEAQKRLHVFQKYQLNEKLLESAKADAIIMHPLPAHYGEEVTMGILDSERSVVFDQAENRLHAQKAVLAEMLGGLGISLANCI